MNVPTPGGGDYRIWLIWGVVVSLPHVFEFLNKLAKMGISKRYANVDKSRKRNRSRKSN